MTKTANEQAPLRSVEQFQRFIEDDMRMSHIYQPLLIRMSP